MRRRPSMSNGISPWIGPDERASGVVAGQLERDVGAGVARPDHQHGAGLQLRSGCGSRSSAAARSPGPARSAKSGRLRLLPGARGDHDVVGGEPVLPGGHDEAVAVARAARRQLHAGADRQRRTGPRRPRGSRPPRPWSATTSPCRDAPAGQPVVLGRAVEPQRVEPVAPDVADPVVRVQDQERAAPAGQVVAGGQAGLAGADDDGLDVRRWSVMRGLLSRSRPQAR